MDKGVIAKAVLGRLQENEEREWNNNAIVKKLLGPTLIKGVGRKFEPCGRKCTTHLLGAISKHIFG